jgi:hypothetical protein
MAAVLTLLGGIFSAEARLGEARNELVSAKGRYGEPTGESTPALKDSLDKVDVFEKDDIGVEVEYAADGKVWRITYRKKDLSEKLINNLLAKNSDERKWSKPTIYRDNKHWVSKDKEMHAVYYGNSVYKLVVMTTTAIHAERRPQKIEGRETKRIGESEASRDEPEKKSQDPLDGF